MIDVSNQLKPRQPGLIWRACRGDLSIRLVWFLWLLGALGVAAGVIVLPSEALVPLGLLIVVTGVTAAVG